MGNIFLVGRRKGEGGLGNRVEGCVIQVFKKCWPKNIMNRAGNVDRGGSTDADLSPEFHYSTGLCQYLHRTCPVLLSAVSSHLLGAARGVSSCLTLLPVQTTAVCWGTLILRCIYQSFIMRF